MSMALSPSVAARHSRDPGQQRALGRGDDPVPGLLNDRNVVVPPNAAATESWKNRSGSASVATRVCVWTSTAPGRTSSPVASMTSRRGRRPPRSGSTLDPPASIAMSPAATVRRDDGPARTRRSAAVRRSTHASRRRIRVGHRLRRRPVADMTLDRASHASCRTLDGAVVDLGDPDRLGALPQAAPPDLAQAVGPAVVGLDGREHVRRELAHLRRRRAPAVREEDLALADAARVDRELAGRGMRRVVLVVEPGPEVPERDPRRLARPAAVDQLRLDRQHPPDGIDVRGAAGPSGR